MVKKRIVIGVSGASGVPITVELLRALKHIEDWESHLVITDGGKRTIQCESELSLEKLIALSDVYYDNRNIGAPIASGTFRTEGMIIVPCSMKTVSGIASGYSENLLLRAADVTLKEGRTLLLTARETPLSAIHLKNLLELSRMGAVIMPPVLSFYNKPETIDDMLHHIVGKMLDRFNLPYQPFHRWGQESGL